MLRIRCKDAEEREREREREREEMKIKRSVYLKFRDGYSKLLKIIEMNSGIKISPIDEDYEMTIHPNRSHLKKLKRDRWDEPESEKNRPYMYVNFADYDKLNGVIGIFMPLYINGISLEADLPKKDDVVLPVDKGSNERLWVYVAYCNTKKDRVIDNHMKVNNIDPFVSISIRSKNIIVGIRNE